MPSEYSRPFVLLTNDDGVRAPGLLALVQSLRAVAEVAILAPERNWSACGHTKTMHKPLRVKTVRLVDGTEALATNGSPSDCVALALLGVLERKPDLVIAGINQGANLGHDLTYSGTVSAAMEAVIWGVSGVAISVDSYQETDCRPAAEFAAQLALMVVARNPEKPLLLNVNVPALPKEEIRGVLVTRLGKRIYRDVLVRRRDPRGQWYYWFGGDPPDGVEEHGTDIGALRNGYISVTPLALDLTDYQRLQELQTWGLDSLVR